MSKTDYRVVDPILTTLIQGYNNASMVSDALFPTIPLQFSKGKIPIFNKSAFVVRDTIRAIGANSNRIPVSDYVLLPFELQERDIEIALDYLEEDNSAIIKLEQKVTQDLCNIIALGKEKQAADMALNPANYTTSAKYDCSSTQLSDEDVNPIDIIKDAAESVRSRIGKSPNTAVIGASVYRALMDHPAIIDRVKFSGIRKVNTLTLSELFEIPNIKVGYAQYADDLLFKDVWSDSIVLAYVDENEKGKRSEYNPSFGYTLQKQGCPEIDSYYENGGKIKVIRATDNYSIQVTCPDAAYLIYHALSSNE
ncbi:MAG: major capsid protein [Ignavibacteria bacterium]|jgi:hypothetical protein|nr:major capsid protein [Ignavibacteria bacterium]